MCACVYTHAGVMCGRVCVHMCACAGVVYMFVRVCRCAGVGIVCVCVCVHASVCLSSTHTLLVHPATNAVSRLSLPSTLPTRE